MTKRDHQDSCNPMGTSFIGCNEEVPRQCLTQKARQKVVESTPQLWKVTDRLEIGGRSTRPIAFSTDRPVPAPVRVRQDSGWRGCEPHCGSWFHRAAVMGPHATTQGTGTSYTALVARTPHTRAHRIVQSSTPSGRWQRLRVAWPASADDTPRRGEMFDEV